MTGFNNLDYGVFILYIIASVAVGVWFVREQKSIKDYFLAGQSMNWFMVSISVIAALFSGISYLGAPTEVFNHDMTYSISLVTFFIATPVVALVFLPFFYRLKLYSAYEYLEKRFDLQVRTWSSAMFIIRVVCYLALAIYAPAMAIAEVTGLPLWMSIVGIAGLTTIYTTLGGMKAVIWTDVMQFFVLFGGMLVVGWIAISKIPGGLQGTIEIADFGGKFDIFRDTSWSLTARFTFWGCLIGPLFANLVQMGTDQISVQRYLTAKSLPEAQKSLWFKLIITVPIVILFYLMGAVLYAFYQSHPELLPTDLKQPDRIMPHFVVHELPHGVPGMLIAAIFAATMSTVSSGINALTTASMMDFYRRNMNGNPDPDRMLQLSRRLTAFYGVLAMAVAFLMPLMGTLVEATNKIMGLLGGPLLGVFLLGMLTKRANAQGTLLGAFVGSVGLTALAFGAKIDALWFSAFGCVGTFVLGYLFSLATGHPAMEKLQGLVYSPRDVFSKSRATEVLPPEPTDSLQPRDTVAMPVGDEEVAAPPEPAELSQTAERARQSDVTPAAPPSMAPLGASLTDLKKRAKESVQESAARAASDDVDAGDEPAEPPSAAAPPAGSPGAPPAGPPSWKKQSKKRSKGDD